MLCDKLKAVIFAGGNGLRFGFANKILPKSLVPIQGTPMLIKVINNFSDNPEVDEIIVLAAKNRLVRNAVESTKFRKPVMVITSPPGQIGELMSLRQTIGKEPFFVGGGDMLASHKFPTMEEFKRSGALMAIGVTENIYPKELTSIELEGDKIKAVKETQRGPTSRLGVTIDAMFSPKVFDFIQNEDMPKNATAGDLFQKLFERGKKIVPLRVPREKVIHISRFYDWWSRRGKSDTLYATLLAIKTRIPKIMRGRKAATRIA